MTAAHPAPLELTRHDRDWLTALGELFFDVVDDGASLGFLAEVGEGEMREYWEGVFDALGERQRLWIVHQGGRVLGTVQLSMCSKPNGRHRAEVQKLMVHPHARRGGIAARLMAAAEGGARAQGLSLLVLDTTAQSAAEPFYQSLGWQRVGEIPHFAANPDGTLAPTALYWKRLD
ncbi:GNAT family N-acetyltransferase [Roseateles amylovorans]|jgi:acetyltransferase|uniref:GNAT family N-acetyltransferase n=1 Tax=Roseateles amylovorans TaxID=2978473 RepID=A0ABY6B137_9BURK|nr:GNAT family N-acetyltransferase [Roseateles amylovorans]UXH77901.1 GNAT family N-acetyltransferase [Roseateles amylovorans]